MQIAAGRTSAAVVVVAAATLSVAAAEVPGPLPEVEVVVAEFVAADGAPASDSSMTSSSSVVSTTVLASIALLITAAAEPMSALWRKRCRRSCPKRS